MVRSRLTEEACGAYGYSSFTLHWAALSRHGGILDERYPCGLDLGDAREPPASLGLSLDVRTHDDLNDYTRASADKQISSLRESVSNSFAANHNNDLILLVTALGECLGPL